MARVKKRPKQPTWLTPLITSLLEALQEEELRQLLVALESKGADFGHCVMMERSEVQVPVLGTTVGPHVILMMAFRWKDFPHPPDPPPPLRKLTCCSSANNAYQLCINPYHWCMHLLTEPPALEYEDVHSNDLSQWGAYGSSLSHEETETYGSDTTEDGRPWCKIMYWEYKEKRGQSLSVLSPSLNIFGDTPYGSGLSLAALFVGPGEDESVARTRNKIGKGLVLWRDGGVVWLYNRSETAVYLNSATLDGSCYQFQLYKCPPGYAMIIYYYDIARRLLHFAAKKSGVLGAGPSDVNSVRVSFAKGWGNNYHRRDVLCCPSWLEVHISPALAVDKVTPPR